jgi:adenine-specific DNA-methyltransferase
MTIKEETLHSNIETVNSKQLAILKKHFPQCFDKSENFIQEKMLEVVNANEVELSKESYTLNWLGKSYARVLTNLPPKTLINEDIAHNQLEQNKNSKNLLIKGDNLEVLKHMINAYSEKVKMIYIDPPYNTGSDGFVYNDDRSFTKEQLVDLAGIDPDEASRILEFTDKGSNSHSAWLTFMHPRLYVAKELLKDDGVIFISIDDNEVAQLKVLCDEIFGEGNFVNQITVKAKSSAGASGGGEDLKLKKNVEFLLCYCKNKSFFTRFNDVYESKSLISFIKEYKEEGKSWKYTRVLKSFGEKSFYKDILDGSGENIKIFKHQNIEIMTISEIAKQEKISEEEVYVKYFDKIFRDTNAQSSIRQRVLEATDNLDTFYSIEYVPITGRSKGKLTTLYYKGRNKDIIAWLSDVAHKSGKQVLKRDKVGTLWSDFNWNNVSKEGDIQYPNGKKPIAFIQRMIELTSSIEKNDLVLDFFAGSGSVAHAVMDINQTDGGKRRCISIQIPEAINEKDKAKLYSGKDLNHLNTIFDITVERLRRSASKYSDIKPNLGFKIFETVEDFRIEESEKELTLSNLTMFDDVMLTDKQYHTLLSTWRLYDGSELTTPVQDIYLDGYTAHLCDNRLYLIAPDFSGSALKALLKKIDADKEFSPNKIVFFGKNFESVKQMELNEALKSYANKKSLEIDLVGRN